MVNHGSGNNQWTRWQGRICLFGFVNVYNYIQCDVCSEYSYFLTLKGNTISHDNCLLNSYYCTIASYFHAITFSVRNEKRYIKCVNEKWKQWPFRQSKNHTRFSALFLPLYAFFFFFFAFVTKSHIDYSSVVISVERWLESTRIVLKLFRLERWRTSGKCGIVTLSSVRLYSLTMQHEEHAIMIKWSFIFGRSGNH